MQEIQYKTFSLNTHKKNWQIKRPNVCQFELTFGCGLHCRHCYTSCYNHQSLIKKELKTKQVKLLLDKAFDAGVLWMCFTGGDPLTRKDFLEIYSYAKDKGFIVTVFTNGYSMTKEIANQLKKSPPFVIEMTLNAATKETYEKISRAKGSFEKVMQGIDLMLKARVPLKIKIQVMKDNLEEYPKIKKFIRGLGLRFLPSSDLYARLNGDLGPCNLRLMPEEILSLNGKKSLLNDDCQKNQNAAPSDNLFRCTVGGGDGINIDPYGNTFSCNLIRKPRLNLLEVDIPYAMSRLLPQVRNIKFSTDSKCKGCTLREICHSCPGRAYLETGDMEAPVEYYCELAQEFGKFQNVKI